MLIRSLLIFILSFTGYFSLISSQQFCVAPKITYIQGNEDPFINCDYTLGGNCLTLKTTYPEFHDTSTYNVNSAPFTPYGDFNSGTPLKANADDLYINKIVLPFSFCYFGTNFSEVVIGSNGILTFESNQLGNVDYPNVQTLNPNTALPGNTIFGVKQDLVFSSQNDSEIYYSIIGTAPCRKLVVNFYKGRVVGCNQTSTSQIVLSEGSNLIEIFVDEKALPCADAKFKNTLLGIVNGDGSVGYSPATRNTGVWEASKEAWRFTPTGATIVPDINWYNSDNKLVGSGEIISVCPEKNETYTVKIKYPVCGNSNLVLEDQTSVTFAPDFPLVKSHTKIFCGTTSSNVNLDDFLVNLTPQNPSNLKITFHLSETDAQTGANPQPKDFVLTANVKFFVRVENLSNPTCFRTTTLNLNLISRSLLTSTAEICDVNNDGIESNYTLSLLNPKLFAIPLSGKVHYYKSQSDAATNTNEIISADIKNNMQLYITYETPDCSQIFGPVTISFLPSPVINTPIDFSYKTCDYVNDNAEPFDFLLNLGPLISTNPNFKFSFYATYDAAFSGTGAQLLTVKEGKYTIFARVEIPGGCFSIATINLDITFTKVEATEKAVYICFDGFQDITVKLDDYTDEMLIKPLTGISVSYYLTPLDAENDVNPISTLQTITDNGSFVTKSFWVKFMDATGCYALKELRINLVHVIIAKTDFEICDFKNDGSETVNLAALTAEIIGSQNASVTYYSTSSDAQSNTNAITTFQLQNSGNLFVRILSYECSNVFQINLKLTAPPAVKAEVTALRNSVCDNNNDGQEKFDLTQLEAEIYNGAQPVNFEYYRTYNAADNSLSGLIETPTAFSVAGTAAVYARVSLVGGCYSVSKINIELNFLPGIVLKEASLQKCDYDFNLNESFNLNDALALLFSQEENAILLSDLKVAYYATEAEANAGIAGTEINSNVVSVISELNVYARFTSKTTTCYSVAVIKLLTYLPPKALNSIIPDICDNDLDGLYDVDLTQYTAGMVYQFSADNIFTFFNSDADASANINPILNPEKFSVNPLPTRLWVRVENIPGCFDIAFFDLKLGTKIPLDNRGPFTVTNVCDIGNDGVENVNLTQFESQMYSGAATFEYYISTADLIGGLNKISTPANYLFDEKKGPTKVFVKISASGFCPDMAEINLTLKKTPMFSLPDYFFCPDGFVDIQPDFSDLDIVKFEWINPAGEIISTTNEILKVKIEGVYIINVTARNGCTFTTNFNVKKYEVPVITELIPSGNSYTVIATGSRSILYSIDGVNFQTSNVFNNLSPGVITFYVKFSDRDCLGIIRRGLILNLRNSFTPNGDGVNDTYFIDDIYVFEGKKANFKVYDRYQKLLFEQDSDTRLEWNGKTGLRGVSTDSYWYILTLPDGRTFNGWILLKNRN